MNSSKRGAVYGFKLQSLDLVSKPEVPFGHQMWQHGSCTWQEWLVEACGEDRLWQRARHSLPGGVSLLCLLFWGAA